MVYRVEVTWGYWMFYAAQPYHHVDYRWDGRAYAQGGTIARASLIQYDMLWHSYGPSARRLTPLGEPCWSWHATGANRRIGGVELAVEGAPETVVTVDTRVDTLRFTLGELADGQTVTKHIGGRYSCVRMEARLADCDPRLYSRRELEAMTRIDGRYRRLYRAAEMGLPLTTIRLEGWAAIGPGESAVIELERPTFGLPVASCAEATLTLAGMHFKNDFSMRRMMRLNYLEQYTEETPDYDNINCGEIPFAVYAGEVCLLAQSRIFQGTGHLREVPGIEEATVRLKAECWTSPQCRLRLENRSDISTLYLGRILLEEKADVPLDFVCAPEWVLPGNTHWAVLEAHRDVENCALWGSTSVRFPEAFPERLPRGRYAFSFTADGSEAHPEIRVWAEGAQAHLRIRQVIRAPQEARPMQVGAEGLLFLPNDPGKTENAIAYVAQRQIASHFAFRGPGRTEDFARWIGACRRYGITYSFDLYAGFYDFAAVGAPGDPLFSGGLRLSECDGAIWGYTNQQTLYESIVNKISPERRTMRTSAESFVAYWKALAARKLAEAGGEVTIWGHVSSLCHQYLYMAGLRECVSQLNKTHNVLLLSEARGACRALGGRQWGSYSAEGAHLNPEDDQNLRMWKLQFMLSYVMGASCANDEEHLLRTWHERLYGNHDRELAKRQKICGDFLRYTRTHPRQAEPDVRQAVLLGRYACDVSDGLATHFGDPPRVWGFFGGEGEAWAYGTPEYGLRCLDAFFPGVWLHSLIQSPETVRRWYSGTPLGETDLIPADSCPRTLAGYDLLVMMGWNSADSRQYARLSEYVREGGTLIMCLPQLSENEDRAFLQNGLEPLNLVHGGDFDELFGVKVLGKGGKYRNVTVNEQIADNPLAEANITRDEFFIWTCPMNPQHDHVYMADVRVEGAQVLGWEEATGQPFLVRKKLGKGCAYLFTAWEYMGNSRLTGIATDLIRAVARGMKRHVTIEDGTGDVYFSVREEATGTRVSLINTDWTREDGVKRVRLTIGGRGFAQDVAQGRITEVLARGDYLVRTSDENLFLRAFCAEGGAMAVSLMGRGICRLEVSRTGGVSWEKREIDFEEREAFVLGLEG